MNPMSTSRATPPGSRRSSNVATSPPSVSSARPALASVRSPNSQSTALSRSSSIKVAPVGTSPESRESLIVSLKHETERKEQLLVQVQIKDQTISSLTAENDNLMSALNSAESRLNDLYADQARMEEEMAARIEVAEKLRAQVKELEREKRDLQRRYNEQTSTFEAERQAFYDNEQHLRSRIQSLTQSRKFVEKPQSADMATHTTRTITTESSRPDNDVEEETEVLDIPSDPQERHSPTKQDLNDPESEPAEMTSLKLELSTLSTSYASLQSTLILLQMQLVDLKRVNNQLQEDNESYMILLREKTLSGQFDLMKQVGGASNTTDGGYDDEVATDENADIGSLRSTGRSVLDRVDEEMTEDDDLEHSDERHGADSPSSHRHHGRHGRRIDSASHSPSRAPLGESLADLPITGPGLDLAAELGRAENKDILAGNSIDGDRPFLHGKGRNKGSTDARKVSSSDMPDSNGDLEALRSEVKTLKDANKALSLYASKILDRIIAQEGFEQILAVDYEKPSTMRSNSHKPTLSVTTSISAPVKPSKPRPQSAFFSMAASDPAANPASEKAPLSPSISDISAKKSQRRSMSFDFKSFSLFGGGEKKPESANLRPLTLKPDSTTPNITSARKLETYEDEEDRRERERLHATMKLMGIEKPVSSLLEPAHAVPMQKSYSTPESPLTATVSRFSIFRSRSTTGHSDASSVNSGPSMPSGHQSTYGLGNTSNGLSELTREALEQAEAVNSLAALDAHEQTLSEEIAKGKPGGFTEPPERRSRRSIRSGGGSGSTVWSAGMSRAGDEPDS